MDDVSSDTDNEAFESAEESVDENTAEDKPLTNESDRNSDNEVTKQDQSIKNSFSVDNYERIYRKRPERTRRKSDESFSKINSLSKKINSNELVLKSQIVPDVSLQDLTTSLSNNINNSLTSIQQTSSNVKNLIFSSLPVNAKTDHQVFSYDDKNFPPKNHKEIDNNSSSESIVKNYSDSLSAQKCDTFNLNNISDVDIQVNKSDSKINHKCTSSNEDTPFNESFCDKDSLNLSNLDGESQSNKFVPISDLSIQLEKKEVALFDENEDREIKVFTDTKACSKSTEDVLDKEAKNNCRKLSETDLDLELDKKGNSDDDVSKCDDTPLCSPDPIEETNPPADFLNNCNKYEKNQYLETENINNKNKDYRLKIKKSKIAGSDSEVKKLKNVSEAIVNSDVTNTYEKGGLERNWDDFKFDDEDSDSSRMKTLKCSSLDSKVNIADESKNKKILQKKSLCNKDINSDFEKVTQKNVSVSQSDMLFSGSKEIVNEVNNPENPTLKFDTETLKSREEWDWDDWGEENSSDLKNPENNLCNKVSAKENIENNDPGAWSGWETFGQKQDEKQVNWGVWGVNMILNKATAVTQGISSAFEASLGVPDPETLVRMEKIEKERNKLEKERNQLEKETESETVNQELPKNPLSDIGFPVFGITNLVAGVTSKIVDHSKIQEIGSKVITGSLDTLESFGKKTMEVLQDGDPGLRSKRALLLGMNKPVLSQVLKEAREKTDNEIKKVEEKEMKKKCHFEGLFDDFQGMVHLEALEMLSKQCEIKIDQIRNSKNDDEKDKLNNVLEEVEQLCSLDDFDLNKSELDFKDSLKLAVEPLKKEIILYNIIKVVEEAEKWLDHSLQDHPSPAIVLQKTVSTLAELTAATVQQFHKAGELISIKQHRKTVEETDSFSRMTDILCHEVAEISKKFIKLSKSAVKEPNTIDPLVEKIETVRNNAVSYIKQAFDLVIPVLQVGVATQIC